jgi:hypothetical protein
MNTALTKPPKEIKKPKKFKLKKLIRKSLPSLVSGLWIGIGCSIIDHADSTWFQAKDPVPSGNVAAANSDE